MAKYFGRLEKPPPAAIFNRQGAGRRAAESCHALVQCIGFSFFFLCISIFPSPGLICMQEPGPAARAAAAARVSASVMARTGALTVMHEPNKFPVTGNFWQARTTACGCVASCRTPMPWFGVKSETWALVRHFLKDVSLVPALGFAFPSVTFKFFGLFQPHCAVSVQITWI